MSVESLARWRVKNQFLVLFNFFLQKCGEFSEIASDIFLCTIEEYVMSKIWMMMTPVAMMRSYGSWSMQAFTRSSTLSVLSFGSMSNSWKEKWRNKLQQSCGKLWYSDSPDFQPQKLLIWLQTQSKSTQ